MYCDDENIPYLLLQATLASGRLPVVTFAAGGIATPADVALMMHLGVDGVFVGSGIFESADPAKMAEAVCISTTHYNDYEKLIEASELAGKPMKGIDANTLQEKYALR